MHSKLTSARHLLSLNNVLKQLVGKKTNGLLRWTKNKTFLPKIEKWLCDLGKNILDQETMYFLG